MASTSDLLALSKPFKNPKFIMFSDFDGTITLQDSNDYLCDNYGYGVERRRSGGDKVLAGQATFRQHFTEMMESVTMPFSECIDVLVKNVQLDPGFNEFFQWALQRSIPVVVVSSGMDPIIRALLAKLVGPDHEKIDIISNSVQPRPGKSIDESGGWQLGFHDESDFGHDKSLSIRPYANLPEAQRPTLFYAGDGVSDLSAARETSLLFAKEGNDLVNWCVKQNIPFTAFKDWTQIQAKVEEIVDGKISVQDAAAQGYEAYKSKA